MNQVLQKTIADPVPLVIDMDGTLLRTDVLVEQILAYLKPVELSQMPFRIFNLFRWLVKGRAVLKRQLALCVVIDEELLPVNSDVVKLAEAAKGRKIYLASASDEIIVRRIAARFHFIQDVIASDGVTNLKGVQKSQRLVAQFSQFDYVGNDRADLLVWQHARQAIVVEASPAVLHQAARISPISTIFPRPSRIKALLKAARMHQWAKNLLVFVPMILGGRSSAFLDTLAAFFALGFIASATYLFNDLWDIMDDRKHWSKQNRPLASGQLPLRMGIVAVPLGIVIGLGLGAIGGWNVIAILLIYLFLTLTYSMSLKRVPLLDAFMLATLFTMRLAVGVVASAAAPSPWLFVFSMFLFSSLSFSKRYTEIERVIAKNGTTINGRGYEICDLPLVLAAGVSTGIAAVLITILYIVNDAYQQAFYGNTAWLWGFPVIIFLFVMRLWLVCQRGELHDDPVFFAIKDRTSLSLGGMLIVCFVMAWAGL